MRHAVCQQLGVVCVVGILDQGTGEGGPVQDLFGVEGAGVLAELDGLLRVIVDPFRVADVEQVVRHLSVAPGKRLLEGVDVCAPFQDGDTDDGP